jgi:peptidoglycan L-alanyl-D-glutamate endopeptidase CwlK
MAFSLTQRDYTRLKGLHPDLVRVVQRAEAMTDLQFMVLEGLRTIERQRELFKQKATKTLNSRHIKAKNGYGHAVDLAPMLNGKVSWDWPLYHRLAKIIKAAAKAEKVAIEWGGDWRTFKDGPHWQLPWGKYPGK